MKISTLMALAALLALSIFVVALEAKLKSAEERAQRAEKNADLATSQRIELEAELRKAQENAQLAQNIIDIVRGQSQAKKNGLLNGEPLQKSADLSANQPKSGETQPKAGLTPEPERGRR